MTETWTFSDWSIGQADPAEFVDAFRKFAEEATNLGGAHEGMILQDLENPAHFVVVRRWSDPGEVARWADEQGGHAGELMSLVPEGGQGFIMTKVADFTTSSAGSTAAEAERR